jgi:hypothetical protein
MGFVQAFFLLATQKQKQGQKALDLVGGTHTLTQASFRFQGDDYIA